MRISLSKVMLLLPTLALLLAGPAEATAIRLLWDPPPDIFLLGYNIYRATSPSGPFERINQEPLKSASFSDETAEPGRLYYYSVTTVSSENLESGFSQLLEAFSPRIEDRQPAVQSTPRRTVRPGQLVVLRSDLWPRPDEDRSTAAVRWSQLLGPEPVIVSNAEELVFLAPRSSESQELIFQVSLPSGSRQQVIVRVEP